MTPAAPTKPLGSTLLERIGNTPLVQLDRLTAHLPGVQVFGKAEWMNPGGSVKDRAASSIVADAQRKGLLGPGKTLLDATSGNTGIAYAMLGAAQGFRVVLCMPSNVSVERKRILDAYGAEVLWTDPADGSDGAIRKARATGRSRTGRLLLRRPVRQRQQLARPLSRHRQRDLAADRTASHALHRGARHLRHLHGNHPPPARAEPRHQVHLHAARLALQRPRRPQAHGHRHRPADLRRPPRRPQHRHGHRARLRHVPSGWAATRACSIGVSAAAAVAAALEVAEDEAAAGREAVIVTILCDAADKYLSERYWIEPAAGDLALNAKLGKRRP